MNPWTNEIAPDYFRHARHAAGDGPRVQRARRRRARRWSRSSTRRSRGISSATRIPIGRRFGFRTHEQPGAIEIVGVVKDSLYANMRQGTSARMTSTPRFVYTPYQQSDELNEMTVYVRGAGATASAARAAARRPCAAPMRALPVFEHADDGADGRRGAVQRADAGAAVGARSGCWPRCWPRSGSTG